MLKFVTFIPNVKEAENPPPGASFPLFVYDMNIWFPEDVIVEGGVFPAKTFIWLLQEQLWKSGYSGLHGLYGYQQSLSLPPL